VNQDQAATASFPVGCLIGNHNGESSFSSRPGARVSGRSVSHVVAGSFVEGCVNPELVRSSRSSRIRNPHAFSAAWIISTEAASSTYTTSRDSAVTIVTGRVAGSVSVDFRTDRKCTIVLLQTDAAIPRDSDLSERSVNAQ
jgi:hypothetical protein